MTHGLIVRWRICHTRKIDGVGKEGGTMISDGMVRGLKEFFKEYEGCRNCRHQPEPMQMCQWGKKRQRVEPICSGWEKKDERSNQ